MKLSKYKKLLQDPKPELVEEALQDVKNALNKQGVSYDEVKIEKFYESFLVLRITHKGFDSFTNLNLWGIVEDKNCKWCG